MRQNVSPFSSSVTPMTARNPSKFVSRVRAEMLQQRLSVRALARRIDPINLDRARRNLHRWLDEGIAPGRNSRADVARALGIDAAELDEDDEEADPVAALVKAIKALVRAEVQGHLSAAAEGRRAA